jgi:crotonobetainyl-CoA:carnitine CoA-transferase CaiB-like acyl-CoA transferase
MNGEGAYCGLRVLDLGQGVAAPYCAMLLAMHGAEVVKLEPPEGDWSHGLGTRYGAHTAMSAHYNRGKKSIALDLGSPAAREAALALADRADIVIEGFRPGVADRLGLGYGALAARNPRLLYLSVSGFGQDGPYAQLPCTDSVAQAFSGLMSVNLGNDGAPHRIGAIVVDTLTGLYAAQSLGVGLYARERDGRGRRLEVNLAQCAAAILGHKLAEHILEGGTPRALNVPTGAYRTTDGWIMIALIKEEQFGRLAVALGRTDLAAEPAVCRLRRSRPARGPTRRDRRCDLSRRSNRGLARSAACRRHPRRPGERL